MSEHAIDVRFVVERADCIDHPHLARLLHALYRAECSEMLTPNDVAMVRLLERSLSVDATSEGAATFVVRDRLHNNRIVASVVASTSRQPRSSPLTPKHVGHVLRALGPRGSARFLTTQLRLAQLLCATLPERTTQLHSLIVDLDYRGHGLGVMLVDAVEKYATAVGDERVHLYILDGNDVDRFYQRLGYRTQHIRPRLAAYPGRAMSKNLSA